MRTVFDYNLAKFDGEAFEKTVPYIKKLIDHYGHGKIKGQGYSDVVREFDESVERYTLISKMENFKFICQVLKEIREKNQVDTLKELIVFQACPLTLAIFFLSPLPTTFKSNSQTQILTSDLIMKDKILKYMAVLRLANIYRGIITMSTWFEVYDDETFMKQYGNVLSITDKSVCNLVPELEISKPKTKTVTNFIDFDTMMKDSKAKYRFIELKSKLRLDLSIEDLVLSENLVINIPNVIIVKTPKHSTHYYTQISEQIEIKEIGLQFQLKAMIVIRNEKQVLLVFNNDFQIWNMFEGTNVLSIPRPFARKYFSNNGSRLIYTKY
jgi:hypothetical protein